MDPITIDGLNEDDFRCSIEGMLREGEADAAAEKLRLLIEPHAGAGGVLPARLLTVSAGDISIEGWDALGNQLGRYDRPGHWVSAIGISVVDPSEAAAFTDAPARLAPCIETAFYSDDAYPFSRSDRNDLLEGYTRQGAEWQGNFEQADMTLTVTGVEDLYEEIAQLEARLFDSDKPDPDQICAGSLAACYLSVLLHQAVRDRIRGEGLPRPLCVMTGCVGVYPFFDAPVVSSIECLDGGFTGMEVAAPARKAKAGEAGTDEDRAEERAEDEAPVAVPDAEDAFASLLSLTPRIAKKKMAIELDEEESAAAVRQFEMASAHQLAEAGDAPPKQGKTDYSAYAFAQGEEPGGLEDDDDWADVPGSPAVETGFEQDVEDWFGNLDKAGAEGDPDAEEVAFPVSDVAGPGFSDFAFGPRVAESELSEPVLPENGAVEAEQPDQSTWDEEESLADQPDDQAHPDALYQIPAQPAARHGLRARLADSLQVEAPKSGGRMRMAGRVIAWIKGRLFR